MGTGDCGIALGERCPLDSWNVLNHSKTWADWNFKICFPLQAMPKVFLACERNTVSEPGQGNSRVLTQPNENTSHQAPFCGPRGLHGGCWGGQGAGALQGEGHHRSWAAERQS